MNSELDNGERLLNVPRCFVMAYPPQARAGRDATISGEVVATLDPAVPADSAWPSLPVSFDDVYRDLGALPGVFLEPDGSFVLTASPEAKLEGQLNDEGHALAHLELWGSCRRSEFKSVLGAVGWPEKPLIFLLAEAGVYVPERSFWRITTVRSL